MSFRIIGALIGFFSSGFFGAIVGFMIGSYVDYAYGAEETTSYNQGSFNSYGGYQTNQVHPSDFKNSLLILIAAVMKADGVAMKSELDLVKSMLLRTYGEQESRNMLLQLREYLKKEHMLMFWLAEHNLH